jgi:hypothetical protein
VKAWVLAMALPLGAQSPLLPVGESTFRMQGLTYSQARLEVDAEALRHAVARGPGDEAPLAKALRALREGQVRFRVHQSWTVSVSGKRRREFNQLVVDGVWPKGIPSAMKGALARYMAHSERAVDPGEFWEFEGGGGRPIRSHYDDEEWKALGGGPMVTLIVGLYLEGPDTVPGTRVEFRAGLKRFLEAPPR